MSLKSWDAVKEELLGELNEIDIDKLKKDYPKPEEKELTPKQKRKLEKEKIKKEWDEGFDSYVKELNWNKEPEFKIGQRVWVNRASIADTPVWVPAKIYRIKVWDFSSCIYQYDLVCDQKHSCKKREYGTNEYGIIKGKTEPYIRKLYDKPEKK